jgi:hypothetical protein
LPPKESSLAAKKLSPDGYRSGPVRFGDSRERPLEELHLEQFSMKISRQAAGTCMELEAGFAPFWGSSSPIRVVDCINQSKSGDGLMKRSLTMFGAVAAMMLTATIILTLSHATLSTDDVGSLKCYNTVGIEKAC